MRSNDPRLESRLPLGATATAGTHFDAGRDLHLPAAPGVAGPLRGAGSARHFSSWGSELAPLSTASPSPSPRRGRRLRGLGLLLGASVASTSCASLELTQITHTSEKPSNVAVYFKVSDSKGEPIPGMTAEQFNIYEDDKLVSTFESKQTILNPEISSAHFTLLLVDMSGSVTESGELEKIAEAADLFSSTVESNNEVAIYAFDGSPEIYEISGFSKPVEGVSRIEKVSAFRPKDNSTNLNGAVVAGLAKLNEALKGAKAPLRVGTLVVFTDGTDRASLVTADEMKAAVKDTSHGVFAIGLGGEISEKDLESIGKDGTALATDREKVVGAFESVAKTIEASTKSYYLLSYCSPARKGVHTVAIEAVHKEDKGKGKSKKELKGRTEAEFDATGFGPECDPRLGESICEFGVSSQ